MNKNINKNNMIFNAEECNNIKEIIHKASEKYGDKLAFVIKHTNEEKEVTYEEISYKRMLQDINRLGTAMYDKGYKNTRIAIIGKNRYEWVIGNLSNLLGANVSVPLDKDLQLEELESSLIRSKAECIFFDPKQKEKILKIKENSKTNLKEYICMSKDEEFESIPELIEKGKTLIKKGKKDYLKAKIDNDKMSILLFTSGTTDKSKAVMLSQKNIASNIYAMQCVEDIRDTDTNIAFLPFHHIFGSTGMLMMLASGAKTVFPDGLKYVKKNLNEYKVTVFVGVPALCEAIYKAIMKEVKKQGKEKLVKNATKVSNALLKVHIDIRRKLFKSIIDALGGELRYVISGGAPADPVVSKGFNDMGIKTVQGYGLSETSPVIAAENPKVIKRGTVGIPMVNVNLEIASPDENGVGEIRVKGPNVMLGYYEMEEKTKEVLRDGWFYTGDLGYIDKDGMLVITGRSKDMIVLKNGKKVFPDELEMLVNRIELVEESMVFGLPDKNDKNDIKLSVKIVYSKEKAKELYPDKNFDEIYDIVWTQIKELNQQFPKYKHIVKLILTDEPLIKTTTNKVKRHEEMKKILEEE